MFLAVHPVLRNDYKSIVALKRNSQNNIFLRSTFDFDSFQELVYQKRWKLVLFLKLLQRKQCIFTRYLSQNRNDYYLID
jgi:hypothetical protein